MKKFSLMFMLLLSGCATIPTRNLSISEISYWQKAQSVPEEIILPKDKGEEAWGRAQAFAAQHGDMKIQIATDYVLETYTPTEPSSLGFRASKSPMGDKVKINASVIPSTTAALYYAQAKQREHINDVAFRYYILTGEEPPPGFLSDFVMLPSTTIAK